MQTQFANLCALPNGITTWLHTIKAMFSPIYAPCLSYFNSCLSTELAYAKKQAVIGLSVFVNCFNEQHLSNNAVAIYQNEKNV